MDAFPATDSSRSKDLGCSGTETCCSWRVATALKYAVRTILRVSVSKVDVRVWISFLERYEEVKCLSALRRRAVRAFVD